MNNEIAIKVENVYKKYCKYLKKSMFYGIKDIGRNMFGLSSHSEKLRNGEFWANKNISFELKKGESIGIIGPNGSGKTTLLKMLNGIFWPDKGKITINGKVSALIQVGAGFHPLLTGRENIYVNGAILGMSKQEIDHKFKKIVDFADIGDFLNTSVKYYSSGMFVRLGFAVAIFADPDILLVDEILAVGDMNFRRKCFEKMKSKIDKGMSLVLVTHSMQGLIGIAKETILLNKGKIKYYGSTKDTISKYIDDTNRVARYGHINTATRRGSGEVRIIKAYIIDEKGNEITELSAGDPIRIRCSFKVNKPIKNPKFGFCICDAISRQIVLYANTYNLFHLDKLERDGEFEILYEKPNLGPRRYYLYGGIGEKDDIVPIDVWDDAGEQFIIKHTGKTKENPTSLFGNPITFSPYKFKLIEK